MSHSGYFLSPCCHGDQFVCVASGDLWIARFDEGQGHRFGLNFAFLHSPLFSPCGQFIAFTAGDHPRHMDIYCQDIKGGSLQRLTFLQSKMRLISWESDGLTVSSSHNHPLGLTHLYKLTQGHLEPLPWGDTVTFISKNSQNGGCVVQRHGYGYTSWKRYRGGAAGELWIDAEGKDEFCKLLPQLSSNTHSPFWIRQRIYFLSDHEGLGHLYSCTPQGDDIQQHTHQPHFYVRDSATDGTRIIYSCGGVLSYFNTLTHEDTRVNLHLPHYRLQRCRVSPTESLSDYALHPQGRLIALATRGRLFVMTPWKGPVWQYGQRDGVRYRLVCWLADGQHILTVRDEGLEEVLELYQQGNSQCITRFSNHDWGRILCIKPSPVGRKIALVNHRNDLFIFDLEGNSLTFVAQNKYGPLEGFNWSGDGRWIAFSCATSHSLSQIQVYDSQTGDIHPLTRPIGQDFEPLFNCEGTRLYLLSRRTFQAEPDAAVFDLHFQNATQAYVITLTPDQLSPFIPPIHITEDEDKELSGPPQCPLDTVGIQERLVAFPLSAGHFSKILSVKGKAYLLESAEDAHSHGTLHSYDFITQKFDELTDACDDVDISLDGKWMLLRIGARLRLIKVGDEIATEDEPDTSYKDGGWVNLERIALSINPQAEWQHMFQEAWRLQKELFWNPSMGEVNWDHIYHIYMPCLERATTTQEVHAIIEEMQGELGTSHTYVWSPPSKSYHLKPSFLGATWTFDSTWNTYRLTHIHQGEEGSLTQQSPLKWPGLDLQTGDLLWSIAGIKLTETLTPQELLLGQGGQWIPITFSRPQDQHPGEQREVILSPLTSEKPLLYAAWVRNNQNYVHQISQDRVGYIHIPDMDRYGFSCFSRSYVQEHHRQGLIIDVRYNAGGFVSSLILEKLNRKRLGYDHTRWHGRMPYPLESPEGPMVALTNEYTGSDGDVFCHSFKMLKLGPLIGKRTWGGVVGIWPRHPLLDGTTTSQPEYSFWCHDVGWRLENHGVDPDIEVEGPLHLRDHDPSHDLQLNRGIQEILTKMP